MSFGSSLRAGTMLAALLAVTPSLAHGVDWIGGSFSSNNWSDHLNWLAGDRPDDNVDVHFNGTPARTSPFVNQNYTIFDLRFDTLDTFGTSSSFTINGSGALRINGDIRNDTNRTQIVNASVIFGQDGRITNNVNNGNFGRLGMNFVNLDDNEITLQPSDSGISMGGEITGSGRLIVNGPGTVELGGGNTWTGGMTIRRGTVVYGSGPSLGALEGGINFQPYGGFTPTLMRTSNGTTSKNVNFSPGESRLAVTGGAVVTYSGVFAGLGTLAKTESGTLVLTGNIEGLDANVFVRGGELRIAGNATLPQRDLDIASGATLRYTDGKVDRVPTLTGAGTLALGNDTSFTIGIESAPAGSGSGGDGTFSGPVTGNAVTLVKQGYGTLNLTGSSSYTGTTNVAIGTLLVNNATGASATGTSTVTVAVAATLGGDGRIAGGVDLALGAHLAPSNLTSTGTSIGSLAIGALVARPFSTVHVDLNANGNDRVDVEGSALLDGTLALNLLAATPMELGITRTILHSGGPIYAKFRRVDGIAMTADRSFAVTYGANDVYVTIARPGDANLDGTVGFDDLLTLAQHYETTGIKTWSNGDFNGNAAVTFDDLLTLAQHYGAGALSGDQSHLLGQTLVSDWRMAQSLVPEPMLAGVLLAPALLGRRQR